MVGGGEGGGQRMGMGAKMMGEEEEGEEEEELGSWEGVEGVGVGWDVGGVMCSRM